MGKILSMDLRSRAIGAVEGGMSCRASAEHYGVAPSTVIRWWSRQNETGSYEAGQRGRRAGLSLDVHRDLVIDIHQANRDATLRKLCAMLAEQGVQTSNTSLDRFFRSSGITRKKGWSSDRTRST